MAAGSESAPGEVRIGSTVLSPQKAPARRGPGRSQTVLFFLNIFYDHIGVGFERSRRRLGTRSLTSVQMACSKTRLTERPHS
jgi:hypothetical protein